VLLRLSRNRGFSFQTHSVQPLGLPGAFNITPPGGAMGGPANAPVGGYATKPTWNRCGMSYDMVPELEWTGPLKTTLQGVFAEVEDHPGDE
jgi:hypothetical protein